MPQLHSNCSSRYTQLLKMHSEHSGYPNYLMAGTGPTQDRDSSIADFRHLEQCLDRKEIYVYPFCVNPEGSNPSGAVNFSKVSHAKISITGKAFGQATNYQCDVHRSARRNPYLVDHDPLTPRLRHQYVMTLSAVPEVEQQLSKIPGAG